MNLPRRQKQLYDLLLGRGDVLIVDLFTAMKLHHYHTDAPLISDMQRWISPYVSNLNKNLADHGLKVEPGALKNTYRLVAASGA